MAAATAPPMGANGTDRAKKRHNGRTGAPYAPAFRQEAIALVRRGAGGGVSLARVARDLEVSQDTLRAWVRQADVDGRRREGLTTDERAELTQLRRENRLLKMERELLKNFRARSHLLLDAETPLVYRPVA